MFLHLERHLHWSMSGALQVKDCCVHGSVVNVLVLLEIWRPVSDSGHVCVDGHVLERYLSP